MGSRYAVTQNNVISSQLCYTSTNMHAEQLYCTATGRGTPIFSEFVNYFGALGSTTPIYGTPYPKTDFVTNDQYACENSDSCTPPPATTTAAATTAPPPTTTPAPVASCPASYSAINGFYCNTGFTLSPSNGFTSPSCVLADPSVQFSPSLCT
jgi:hypothetical protein